MNGKLNMLITPENGSKTVEPPTCSPLSSDTPTGTEKAMPPSLKATEKTCRNCSKLKPLDDYYRCKGGKDGYRVVCKRCQLDKQKESLDPVRRKAYSDKYYRDNSEFVKSQVAAYAEANYDLVLGRKRDSRLARVAKDPEKEKERLRSVNLKNKFGITIEQYDILLGRQGNKCAICERHQDEFDRRLAVDHSHRTRRVRGLLCTGCNYRLVARHENPILLRKIADYIEQGTDWYVPEKKKRPRKTRRKVKQIEDQS